MDKIEFGNEYTTFLNYRGTILIGEVISTNTYYIKMEKYYGHNSNKIIGTESDISFQFNLGLEDYRNILKKQFNGFEYEKTRGVFFKNKKDVENALTYLDSLRVMNALIN